MEEVAAQKEVGRVRIGPWGSPTARNNMVAPVRKAGSGLPAGDS